VNEKIFCVAFGNFPCVSLRILFWFKSDGIIGHFMSRKVIIFSFFFFFCSDKHQEASSKYIQGQKTKRCLNFTPFSLKKYFGVVTLLYKK